MTKRTRILALFLFASLIGLSGCYRPTIQQGNILSEADLHAVNRGMTVREVTRAIGNPVLSNIFPDGRLVYIYTLKPNYKKMTKRQLIVTFRHGRVVKYVAESSPKMPKYNNA